MSASSNSHGLRRQTRPKAVRHHFPRRLVGPLERLGERSAIAIRRYPARLWVRGRRRVATDPLRRLLPPAQAKPLAGVRGGHRVRVVLKNRAPMRSVSGSCLFSSVRAPSQYGSRCCNRTTSRCAAQDGCSLTNRQPPGDGLARGSPLLRTINGSATWPGPLRPVPRHDVGACELPIGRSSSTVAVATRQTRLTSKPSRECSLSRHETAPWRLRPGAAVASSDPGQGLLWENAGG